MSNISLVEICEGWKFQFRGRSKDYLKILPWDRSKMKIKRWTRVMDDPYFVFFDFSQSYSGLSNLETGTFSHLNFTLLETVLYTLFEEPL